MCNHPRIRRRMRAESFVEVALVLPLLMLAGAGVVQFSLWMHAEGVVTAAVQDAARVASSETGTRDQGIATAQSLLHDGLGPNAAFVQIGATQDASGVRFESGTLPSLLPRGPATMIPLHASASMARDRFVP